MSKMNDEQFRILELAQKGYYCSQIIMQLALDLKEKKDADLIRAMSGLAFGVGAGSGTCGALSAAACVIALYSGKGSDEEEEHPARELMLAELAEWFEEKIGGEYGGIVCEKIAGENLEYRDRCGAIVVDCFGKAKELLLERGFDLYE